MTPAEGPGDAGTWRLRQQSAQLTRLFIAAGVSSHDTLEQVERLGRHLEVRTELTTEAESICDEVGSRSSRGFDELTRLQEQTDATERMVRSIYDDLRRVAAIDNEAAATVTELVDLLQEVRDGHEHRSA